MRNRIAGLQNELKNLSPRIGLEVVPARLEDKIRGLAAATGATLDDLEFKPETSEGFLKVYPADLTVKGAPEQLSRFLTGIGNLETASRRQGNPAISGGQIEVTIEFLSFDQAGWNASYSCSLRVNPPQLAETNIAKIKLFKDNLADLQAKVLEQKDKLSGVKQALADKCELEKEISGLERQIKLSRDLAK